MGGIPPVPQGWAGIRSAPTGGKCLSSETSCRGRCSKRPGRSVSKLRAAYVLIGRGERPLHTRTGHACDLTRMAGSRPSLRNFCKLGGGMKCNGLALDLSRDCAAPLTTYRVAKENRYGITTERGISRQSSARSVEQPIPYIQRSLELLRLDQTAFPHSSAPLRLVLLNQTEGPVG